MPSHKGHVLDWQVNYMGRNKEIRYATPLMA